MLVCVARVQCRDEENQTNTPVSLTTQIQFMACRRFTHCAVQGRGQPDQHSRLCNYTDSVHGLSPLRTLSIHFSFIYASSLRFFPKCCSKLSKEIWLVDDAAFAARMNPPPLSLLFGPTPIYKALQDWVAALAVSPLPRIYLRVKQGEINKR
jgi:hypothetical protein